MLYSSILQKINTIKNEVVEGYNSATRIGEVLTDILDYAYTRINGVEESVATIRQDVDTLSVSVGKKADIIDLYQHEQSQPLPLGVSYCYKGVPVGVVTGITNDDKPYIAFCLEHENDAGFEPQNHTVMLFIAHTPNVYMFSTTFNTDDAASDTEIVVARAFGARLATIQYPGLMSKQDKQKLDNLANLAAATYTTDGLMSSQDKQKLDSCYQIIQELRSRA